VVHTLHEERDLNSPKALFDEIPDVKPDPEMVKLATQLVDRQTGRYDPADMEDRYEARLRAVIEAKLKGEGITPESEEEPDRGNVIDLMAALKQSLGQTTKEPAASRSRPASQATAKKSAPKPKAASARAAAKKPARKRA
jgi:DNA end-binding protein Ku